MSGGHFGYQQYQFKDAAREIDELIENNNDSTKDEYGDTLGHGFTPETLERFKEASHVLNQAGEMLQRVDWLVSGDDGEECFHSRWEKEVRKNYERS
jgi:hypothetical protein